MLGFGHIVLIIFCFLQMCVVDKAVVVVAGTMLVSESFEDCDVERICITAFLCVKETL